MTTQTPLASNHLVLRVLGGSRDGELIEVATEKCLLGIEKTATVNAGANCAIFRGTRGAVVCSYADNITVNGASSSVHWLLDGDRIEFPNSQVIEVVQLGCPQTDSQTDSPVDAQTDDDQTAENESTGGNESALTILAPKNDRLDLIESQIRGISCQHNDAQNEMQSRFSQIDNRLVQLAEQLFQLVSMAAETDAPIPLTANDQQTSSFEPNTHSQNEDVDSFAAPTLSDEGSSKILSDEESSEIPDESPAASITDSSDEPVEPDATAGGESVSELLARMQSEGQWSGLPSDSEDVTSHDPLPVETPVEHETAVSSIDPGNDVDIQDYMSELLTRMNNGSSESELSDDESPDDEPSDAKAPDELSSDDGAAGSESTSSESVKDQPENGDEPRRDCDQSTEAESSAPVDLLDYDEFVPKQKPEKIESLGAMRELANNSARTALQKSTAEKRKTLRNLQIGIALASFFMSVYYFLVASDSLFDGGFFMGLVCVGISGFIGYRFYTTIKQNELASAQSSTDDESNEQG